MSDKPKFVSITDPTEQDELTADPGDLSKPYPYRTNGHLGVEADQYHAWRVLKQQGEI